MIDSLTKHLKEWENIGWIGIKNTALFQKAAYLLRRCTTPTFFEWVKGHNGDLGNEESNKLAKEGAEKNAPDPLPLDIPPEYDLWGAKLSHMTQALTHKGIQLQNTPPHRLTMVRNLEWVKLAIEHFSQTQETNQTIWKGLRK